MKLDAGRERAFHARDHEVEIVEGADRDLARRAGLRRIGIDVVELLEAGRIFQVAEQRQTVTPRRFLRLRGRGPGRDRKPRWRPAKAGRKRAGIGGSMQCSHTALAARKGRPAALIRCF